MPRAVPLPHPHTHKPRGDVPVRKPDQEYMIGNTTIRIFGPENPTPEKTEQALNEFYAIAWSIVKKCRERGEDI